MNAQATTEAQNPQDLLQQMSFEAGFDPDHDYDQYMVEAPKPPENVISQLNKGGVKGFALKENGGQGKGATYKIHPLALSIDFENEERDYSDPRNKHRLRQRIDSIREVGIQKTFVIYFGDDGKVYVEEGKTRLRAVWYLMTVEGMQFDSIECETEPVKLNASERMINRIIYNDSGSGYTPSELAFCVKQALQFGASMQTIAKRVGRPVRQLQAAYDILGLPEDLQKAIKDNWISSTYAKDLVRENGNAGALQLFKDAKKAVEASGGKKVTKKATAAVKEQQFDREDYIESLPPKTRDFFQKHFDYETTPEKKLQEYAGLVQRVFASIK